MTTVSIHQPEHLVWCGLLDKIRQSDIFIVLDDVQFEKNNFQNRNRTKADNERGFAWLTVPVLSHSSNTEIKNILINNLKTSYPQWKNKYLGIFYQWHHRDSNFEKYYIDLNRFLSSGYTRLSELNMGLLRYFLNAFNITTPVLISSKINVRGLSGSDRVLQLCREVKADRYLSGSGGRNYLNLKAFEENNIQVEFTEWKGYPYTALDLLLRGVKELHNENIDYRK